MRIANLDGGHHGAEHLFLRVVEILGKLAVEAMLDSLDVEGGSVVEADTLPDCQIHAPAAVRGGPGLCQARLGPAAVSADVDQGIEEEPLDADGPLRVPLGCRVQRFRLALQGIYKDLGVCHTSTPISLSSGNAPGISRRFLTRA